MWPRFCISSQDFNIVMINLLEELEANVGRTGEAIGNFRKYTEQ